MDHARDATPRDGGPARFTALVGGDVQAVGYRAFVQRHARDLGVAGSAENLADGRVEVIAEGPRDALDALLVHLRNGPTHADVRSLEVEWGEPGGARGFHTH